MSREIRDLELKLQRVEEQLRRRADVETLKEGREPREVLLTAESQKTIEQLVREVDEIKRRIEEAKI